MKKFVNSDFGIFLLSVIPSAGFYFTLDYSGIMDFISQHQPFFYSLLLATLIFTMLQIRKYFNNKFQKIEDDYIAKIGDLNTQKDSQDYELKSKLYDLFLLLSLSIQGINEGRDRKNAFTKKNTG